MTVKLIFSYLFGQILNLKGIIALAQKKLISCVGIKPLDLSVISYNTVLSKLLNAVEFPIPLANILTNNLNEMVINRGLCYISC